MRMAYKSLPQAERTIVRDALRPWTHRLGVRKSDRSFNSDLWQGATADGFIKKHDIVRNKLFEKVRSGDRNRAIDLLVTSHNHDPVDAAKQIKRIEQAVNQNRLIDLQKLVMNVPQAEADEHLARAAMKLSGWTDVGDNKLVDVTGTDIVGTFKGRQYLIDAQSRTSTHSGMNLGILDNLILPNGYDLKQELMMGNPNERLLDFLRDRRDYSRGVNPNSAAELKLFQSSDRNFNDNPSKYFLNNEGTHRKDGLITSDRSVERSPRVHKDHERLDRNSGPYNPELPKTWDIVDLDQLRQLIDNLTLGNLQDGRIRLHTNQRGNRAKPVITISPRTLRNTPGRFQGLSEKVLQTLGTVPRSNG